MNCKNLSNHIDFAGGICPDCQLEVDQYGNTEEDSPNCCFPDCGCDGARLCNAKNGASETANRCNVEGMYQKNDKEARQL